VLNEEGTYRLYDLQGEYQQFSLGSDATEVGVIDARIHENGLVALTGALTLLEVKGWQGGRSLQLANPGVQRSIQLITKLNLHSRTISASSCMECYPSRLDYIETCRSFVVGRHDDSHRGQSRERGPASGAWAIYSCFSIA